MQEVSQPKNDEIDLFELFETLWRGKWFISGFVAISVLLGGGFLFIVTPIYESKLVLFVENPPPFYETEKVRSDFKRLFYSKSSFEGWKSKNAQSELVFEDFNITEVINGFIFVKKEGDVLANLSLENRAKKQIESILVVKTNKHSLINEFFRYESHINNLLTSEYVKRAEDELKIIDSRLQSMVPSDIALVNNMLNFDRYIASAKKDVSTLLNLDRYIASTKKGIKVISLSRPTFPKKISPKRKQTLALSVVLGGMIGVMYVLVFNTIRKRKAVLRRLQQ